MSGFTSTSSRQTSSSSPPKYLQGSDAQPRNPFSIRLFNVLGTNFRDNATKEALQTLSELYAASTVDIKTNLVQDTHFYENVSRESAARARTNLRRDMENKLAHGSHQFLNALAEVDEKLADLHMHIRAMLSQCDEAEAHLLLNEKASKHILERANSLRGEREKVETRMSIVSLLLSHFTLNEQEVAAMTSRDVNLEDRFFAAMEKTERIRKDCHVLMAGEDGPTKAGLDVMASTSAHLEQAYEKIFRWCSFEFRRIGREYHIEVTPTLLQAMRRLRQRPELLSEALIFLAQSRQGTLASAFLESLTRGGPSGLPRPIELHAHDPMRYVGDMLAWVHQTIAAEREFLESLFELKGDGRMVGSVRRFQASEEEEWIQDMMNSIVGKLCIPLKVRVQQTVRSQESSIMSYKIANLLQFYTITMRRTVGDEAFLSTTLREITDFAYKFFFQAIETQGRTLRRISLDLDIPEVTPPLGILDHVQVLREVMTVYESSLSDGEPERDTNFKHILNVMVDPAVDMCITAAEEKKRMRVGWDIEVFLLNCLTYLQGVLEHFPFTDEKRRDIQVVIDDRVESLTDNHFANVIKDAGLAEAAIACQSRAKDDILSHMPASQPQQLQASLHRFSLWLSGLEVVHSPRLAKLTVQELQTQIHQTALLQLAKAYQLICHEVKRPENKYEAASTLLGSERPFGQIHLLYQIFGLKSDQ